MKEIPLTQGKVAFVDDEDFERVNAFKWQSFQTRHNGKFYARRRFNTSRGRSGQFLHRFILNLPPGRIPEVDHKNGNGLDCQKENMRKATTSENCCNRFINKNNKSGFKGVSFHKPRQKFIAHIRVQDKKIYLGLFSTAIEAAKEYDLAARAWHKEFARLNFPENLK